MANTGQASACGTPHTPRNTTPPHTNALGHGAALRALALRSGSWRCTPGLGTPLRAGAQVAVGGGMQG